MKDKIADILKAYTKKKGISASFVILENYAEELVKSGCVVIPLENEKLQTALIDAVSTAKYWHKRAKELKCDIEMLEQEYNRVFKENVQNQTEVEMLKKLLDDKCDRCIERERAKARAEAIKEFAERVKKEAYFDSAWCVLPADGIDQIAKEMGVEL